MAVAASGTPAMAAEAPGVAWTHHLGSTYESDQVLGLAVDDDGSAYVVGSSPDPLEPVGEPTFDDFFDWVFIRKLDPAGEVVWTQEFEADMVSDVAVGPEGEVIVGGFAEMDSWLRRYHADGELDWHREVAVGRGGDTWLQDVAVGTDGGIAVAGESGDAFVRRYDRDGDLAWSRQFPIRGAASEVSAVAVDEAGGIYVAGATNGRLGAKHRGRHDAFVRKYDADGDVVWTRQFGSRKDDVAADIAVDADGRVVVAGGTYGKLAPKRLGEQDAFVRVCDSDGRAAWTRQFGSKGWENTSSVALDDEGGIYVVGLTDSRVAGSVAGGSFLRKYDPDGSHAWTTQFGGKESGWAYAVAAGDSDVVLVGGESQSRASPSTTDAFVRRYTPDVAPTAADTWLAAPATDADQPEPGPAAGSFSRSGSTNRPFGPHTAALLDDGRVLVVSGLGQARLWDPLTGEWTKAGKPVVARDWGHSATVLADGRVLLVGGESWEGPVAEAEVWDPTTASFARAGAMAVPRMEPILTPLPDGRVLVTHSGDLFGGEDPAAAEVWDPATESFSPAGSLIEARSSHSVRLLPDGRVLVVGGLDAAGERAGERFLATAEVWDPATGSFEPAGTLAEARHNHSATALPNGRVLVVGGASQKRPLATAEVWDPATGSFSAAGTLAGARLGHTAHALPDGRVLVLGGFDARHGVTSAEIWDPAALSFAPAGSLIERRDVLEHVPLPDGRVFVTGDPMDDDAKASAEVWDPMTESFSPTGTMAKIHWVRSATLLADGRVLVVGAGNSMRGLAEVWSPRALEGEAEPVR